MKAIRVHLFGGPEVMKLEEIASLQPGANEIVVQAKAIGVNPIDVYIRKGQYAVLPTLPYTPGIDAAGVIKVLGKNVRGVWNEGDQVFCFDSITGTYAEEILCAPQQIFTLPKGVSFEEGAAIGVPYFTAYRALIQKASARLGETVLIHGATGGVGFAAVQLARQIGLNIIATSGSAEGQKLLIQQGVHCVLDHTKPGYLEEALHFTKNQGVDVVLEMLANVNLGQDLTILAPAARVIVIGARGKVEINPRDLMRREATVMGMMIMKTPNEEMHEIAHGINYSLGHGRIKPVIGRRFHLKDAGLAHTSLMEEKAYGKVILTV